MEDRDTFQLLSDAEVVQLSKPDLLRYLEALIDFAARLENHLAHVIHHVHKHDENGN